MDQRVNKPVNTLMFNIFTTPGMAEATLEQAAVAPNNFKGKYFACGLFRKSVVDGKRSIIMSSALVRTDNGAISYKGVQHKEIVTDFLGNVPSNLIYTVMSNAASRSLHLLYGGNLCDVRLVSDKSIDQFTIYDVVGFPHIGLVDQCNGDVKEAGDCGQCEYLDTETPSCGGICLGPEQRPCKRRLTKPENLERMRCWQHWNQV